MKSEPNTMKRRHSEKHDNISSFHSEVYLLMRDGVSDMHCMSDAYLAEDLKEEYEQRERQV